MNNILAACLLSSLIACTLDDPYMPVNPEEKPAPPVVTEYQPIALTIGANGRFDVSGSSVKIGLNGKNSTYGVCLPQIAQGHFIAEVTADKTTNFGLAIVREKNGKPDFNNYTSVTHYPITAMRPTAAAPSAGRYRNFRSTEVSPAPTATAR